jgi:hypothetical protein
LQGTYLWCPHFSFVSGSSLHEWLHTAATTPPSAGPLRPTIGGQGGRRVSRGVSKDTPGRATPGNPPCHLGFGLRDRRCCALGGIQPPTF